MIGAEIARQDFDKTATKKKSIGELMWFLTDQAHYKSQDFRFLKNGFQIPDPENVVADLDMEQWILHIWKGGHTLKQQRDGSGYGRVRFR